MNIEMPKSLNEQPSKGEQMYKLFWQGRGYDEVFEGASSEERREMVLILVKKIEDGAQSTNNTEGQELTVSLIEDLVAEIKKAREEVESS